MKFATLVALVGATEANSLTNCIAFGQRVKRATGLAAGEDASIQPPPGKVGTVIAWSDANNVLHGQSGNFASSLAWKNLAVVRFAGSGDAAYRNGFAGENWLQAAKVDGNDALKVGMRMIRANDITVEDDVLNPPRGQVGTLVAWSDGNGAYHGAKGHEGSLAWKNLAMINFGGNTRAYRIGFGGQHLVEYAPARVSGDFIYQGQKVRRASDCTGEEAIKPPAGKIGTVVAWSDSKKELHGDFAAHQGSLGWANLAMVKFGDTTLAYRVGFAGEFWLEDATNTAACVAKQSAEEEFMQI